MPLVTNLRVFLAKNGENNVCGKNPLCLAAIAIINKNMRKWCGKLLPVNSFYRLIFEKMTAIIRIIDSDMLKG